MDDFSVGSFYSDVNVQKSSFCDLEHEPHLCPRLHLVKEALLGVSINLECWRNVSHGDL